MPACLLNHPRADECERIVSWELRALGIAPATILEFARLEASLAHHDPVRDAEQLGIGEFDAGAGIAVVVEDIDSRIRELRIESIGNLAYPGRLVLVERHQHHLEGSDGLRPDDA